MVDDLTPILVGAGQFTQRGVDPTQAGSPLDLMVHAAERAGADCGLGASVFGALDTIAVVRFIADSTDSSKFKLATYRNPPESLARRLGAKAKHNYYSAAGGNTPQYLVNLFAERIARGEMKCALIAGSEALDTMMAAAKKGVALDWAEDLGTDPEPIGFDKNGNTPAERAHNMHLPTNVYPLFENAIRGAKGRTLAQHQAAMGQLFAPFTQVAAANPYAWFPNVQTADALSQLGDGNRMVGFPYPKRLNAMIFVNQAAAIIMTSVGEAKRLGIPQDRWVYLHGCGDANDLWYVIDRVNYHSSPAIRTLSRHAFDMAGKTPGDMDFFDLYSCFPSAVQIGAAEIGIAEDDPRGLTVTGGLPYFGGPGNNYVTHSIASMMDRVRGKPGSFGLVTANGWFVTKHSAGIYSTIPTQGPWQRVDPATYQRDIDAMAHPALADQPNGAAKVETYTVVHTHNGPSFGIVIGRLDEDGRRFLSLVEKGENRLARMQEEDMLGRPGLVIAGADVNRFDFS
jgi:acetyl-CoA C-acetyltransferase